MILAATDWPATILSIATLVTALAAAISSFRNWGANARTEKKMDAIAPKIEKVEAHVNSQKTADNAKIEAQAAEIKNLTGLLAERKATAELLAQSAAISAMVVQPPPASAVPAEVVVVNAPEDPVPTTTTRKP